MHPISLHGLEWVVVVALEKTVLYRSISRSTTRIVLYCGGIVTVGRAPL